MKNNIILAIIDGKCFFESIWMFPKIGGTAPKMDGLFHGKPVIKTDDLFFFFPIFLG